MALTLTDEQDMLRETAERFLADEAPVSHLRKLRDTENPDGFSRDLWASFGELGLAGILVPEAFGGAGLGATEVGVVAREIGRNLSPSPFLQSSVGAVTALKSGGELADEWLPRIAAGKAVAAFAVDEGPHHDPADTATTAVSDGNGFRLDGQKAFALAAHAADLLIVSARGEDGETRLFAVDPSTDGIEIRSERLIDSGFAADVTLDGVRVPGAASLGDAETFARTLRFLRTGTAAEMVGAATGIAAMTADYLKTRTQFGVPIGVFQALQHRAAHLYAEIEVANAAVRKAETLLDAGHDGADDAVHAAKAMADMAVTLAVQEGVQMHGGIGMTDEHDAGFFMKRARVLSEMFGDADYHADMLARRAGY